MTTPVTFAPPDYYDLLQRFAVQGPVSAGIPVVEALRKAGYVETTTQITEAGKRFMKAEARRLRPVPLEPSRETVEILAHLHPAIRKASGAIFSPDAWANDFRDAKAAMLVEGGQVYDCVTWADSGDEVRIVRPEFRVRLTQLGLDAVGRFEEQQAAERRSADRILAMVEQGKVSDAQDGAA